MTLMLLASACVPKDAPARGCTYPQTLRVLNEIGMETSLDTIMNYLDGQEIDFGIYSRDEQRISPLALRDRDFEELQPVWILFVLDDPAGPGIVVRENELVSLRFDEHQRLTEASCEKVYTGP